MRLNSIKRDVVHLLSPTFNTIFAGEIFKKKKIIFRVFENGNLRYIACLFGASEREK
jgi:hypothetical protein